MRTSRVPVLAVVLSAILGGTAMVRQIPPLQEILLQKPAAGIRADVWADVRRFYEARNGSLAWSDGRRWTGADEAVQLVRRAFEHGFAGGDYGEPQLTATLEPLRRAGTGAPDAERQRADFDVRLTAVLIALGHDVAVGRTTPERVDPRWKARRTSPDLAASLNAATAGRLKTWLDDIRPTHPEYAALQKALAHLHGLQTKGGWPKAVTKPLKPGSSGPEVTALRQRLQATGELAPDTPVAAGAAPPGYDSALEDAIRTFQDHHGIKATGSADAVTLAAMNVSLGARLQQIATNLERWRWMPDDLGQRHILVNIPAYGLNVRESGKSILSMRVVVGQADATHRTPVFSSTMTNVVFSPYWNVPDTIADGEVGPAVARDPAYLSRQNMEVLKVSKDGTSPVDPSSVDWGDPEEMKQLVFRQRPGAKNALGHVKFLIPNPFDVYLHDTPADHLFAKPGRALSHGCVRLEQPEDMAKYALRDDPEWDAARIREAMHAGTERSVKLKQPIPVHIAYFTAWVDEQGGLHFVKDAYRYDSIQARQN